MSLPGEQPQKSRGRHRLPRARIECVSPCFNGGGLFCKDAWAGLASKFGLSPRQGEVAQSTLAHRSDEGIAQALSLSRRTVHTHVERLYEKLEIHSHIQLAPLVFATYLAWRIESPPPIDYPLRSRFEPP